MSRRGSALVIKPAILANVLGLKDCETMLTVMLPYSMMMVNELVKQGEVVSELP